MSTPGGSTDRRAAGSFLVIGFAVNLVAVLMFVFSTGRLGNIPRTGAFVEWERSILAAAVVLLVVGFVLLERSLAGTNGAVYATVGASVYAFAATLVVAAEMLSFTLGDVPIHGLTNAYVMLAFVAQACVGAAVLRSGFVPRWIGWFAIGWNLLLLVVLPLVTPRDIYYPLQHHIVPIVLGIALLRKGPLV